MRPWIWALLAFLPFPVAAFLLTRMRDLPGAWPWIVWIALIVLGVGTAVLVWFFAKARQPARDPGMGPARQIEAVLADARQRLRRAGRDDIRSSRTLLLIGPPDGAKTSLVEYSALGAELLVGEVSSDDAIIPTEVANLWVAGDTVLIEAGADVLDDPDAWKALVKGLRPKRWAAALGRGRLPPRAALVCVPVSDLLAPDAPEALRQLASDLRDRLGAAAVALGVQLPVYVVFTKADRIPSFGDFAAVLDDVEANGVLGATVPFDLDLESTAYGERQTRALGTAFDRLFRSLGRARLRLLSREPDPQARLSAYELPRELNKLRDPIIQLLVEIGRPSQLGVGPRLRGFYFTGVRAVDVSAPGAPVETRPAAGPGLLEATRIFSVEEFQQQAAPAPSAGVQQVPQWLFTDQLLRQVIAQDQTADVLTGSGTKVHVVRRGLLAAGIALLAVGAVGATVSYRNNAALSAAAEEAIRATSVIPESVVGVPDMTHLVALDSLRQVTARLSDHQRHGAPLRYRWGLYRGDRIREVARRVYFDRFQRLLLADARGGLIAALGALGDDEGSGADPGTAYDALKAYLITAGYADRSTADFLSPVLYDHWGTLRPVGPESAELVRAQFAFYADELPLGDPYTYRPDDALVASSRDYIRSFSDDGRYYGALIDEADRQASPVDFAALHPESASYVGTAGAVPGAFTEGGWDFVHAQLENIDALFSLEDWVVGGEPVPPSERQAMADAIRSRYEAEYVARWTAFLDGATVARGGGPAAAAARLRTLSGRESPLLQLLALVSSQTDVDSTVAAVFQPVHTLVPPDQTDRLIGEGNQAYVDALAAVGTALGPLGEPGGATDPAALSDVSASVDQARNAVREVTQGFVIEGPAGEVGDRVAVLLEAPIEATGGLARGLPAQQANAAAASFCSEFDALTRMYPFTSGGPAASLDDFVAMFAPVEGGLWRFYERSLTGLVERRGSRYDAVEGANPRPSGELIRFFNDAATFSSAMFTDEGEGPELVLGFRMLTSDRLTEVEVNVDGQIHQFTRTSPGVQAFRWSADRARNADISGVLDGEAVRLVEPEPGQWALFRLFQIAEWRSLGGSRFAVTWDLPSHGLVLEGEVSLNSAAPVLSRSFLSGLRCTPRIS